MKKLLIAIASAASIAGMAKAAALDTETGTSFTGNTVGVFNPGTPDTDAISGNPVGSPYWSVPNGADTTSLQIKKGELPKVTRPTQWQGKDDKDEDGNEVGTYLSIDISEKLTRKINAVSDAVEGTAYDMGTVYFDSLVQFTATDTEPTPETGDKLIVWLKGTDADAEKGVEATTNLVVTAGAINSETLSVTATPYDITGVDIQPNTWHRLTIKTLADVGGFVEAIPGFKVYIDGTQVASGDTTIFPSLVKYNATNLNPTTLTSVSFQGTGAVDDIVFTNQDPFPEAAPYNYAVTLVDDDGVGPELVCKVDGKTVEPQEGVLSVPANAESIEFVVAVPDGYKLANTGAVKGAYDETKETYDWTLTVAASTLAKDGTDSIALTVVEDSTGGDEPGGEDWKPASETEGKTAGQVYGITGELATVDATALTAWATGNGGVQFSKKDSINPECFLLDIANGSSAEAIKAAEDTAKKEIGITQISFDEKGNVVLTYPVTYKNGVVVVEGKAALTDETWLDKKEGDQFFRTVLKISK